jgi:hypothetical protein
VLIWYIFPVWVCFDLEKSGNPASNVELRLITNKVGPKQTKLIMPLGFAGRTNGRKNVIFCGMGGFSIEGNLLHLL